MIWLRTSVLARVIVWTLAAFCAAWALMRTFGLERGFPLQAVIAWTPFTVPVAVLATALAGAARRWGALAAAGLASLLLIVAVAPRAFGGGHTPPGADGPELGVMGANLRRGGADPGEVARLVEENEIAVLCLQELTPELAAELERVGLGELLPHAVVELGDGSRGSAILARHPLRELPRVEPAGYPLVMPRAAVRVPGAPAIEVVSVHPVPPTGPQAVRNWEAGLEALPAAGQGPPLTLLVGDFNATLDHREFRDVIDSGYVDAGDATGKGLTITWPEHLFRPGVTIDHVLADERVAITEYEVHTLRGSDHRAVSATLRLPAG